MAKAKRAEETGAGDKNFIKKYGDYITTGDKVLEVKRTYKTISISPAIDLALGGGIKEGSWLILSGEPKSGKTTTAMQIIANCQREGRKIFYLDVEGRLKEMNFEVPEIDASKVTVIRSKDQPISAETFLDIARDIICNKENEGCVVVIDSISSLIPSKDLDEDVSGTRRPGLPKIMSDFCKKMGQIVPNQKCLVVMITHMITNIGDYGKSKNPDGGEKIKFQSDTRMEVAYSRPWESAESTKDNKDVVGLNIKWNIVWSSIGSPYKTCESWIKFGEGIDKVQEIMMIAADIGLISVAGSWYHLDFLDEIEPEHIKFQGQDKTYGYLKANPDKYKLLEQKVREALY
jgi:recombination protein RecA